MAGRDGTGPTGSGRNRLSTLAAISCASMVKRWLPTHWCGPPPNGK